MSEINVRPERMAQLEAYAQRREIDTAAALDEALAAYLDWEQTDFEEALVGIRRGYEDVRAGRTVPASEFLDSLREKHGLPG
ncbi:MAG: hypothetical protein JNL98_10245 [Bryobacterales bacterium]|nr:hypothetical protein [Bryobacterales bacterium]